MKVVINGRFLTQNLTGVQRFAFEISKRLSKVNGEIILLTPSCKIRKEYSNSLKIYKVGYTSGHLWEQIELPLWLRKNENPILLNLCNTGPIMYKNKIVTIHDLAFIVNPKWFKKKFVLWYKFLIPKLLKSSFLILTVSKTIKNQIVDFYNLNSKHIEVIYNASSFTKIAYTLEENNVKENIVLAVSSHNPRKNLKTLVAAFIKSKIDYHLIIVGGKGNAFAETDLEQNKDITFLSSISDKELINLYKNSKIFVYPSFYEGFGIPPLEAQGFGCTVLVSDIPIFNEVYSDSVVYFNPYSENDLKEKLIYATNLSFQNEYTIKSKVNFAKYNWDKSTTKLISLIHEYAS